MKRHPAFVPLSKDHHRVLLLAQGLRADGPSTLRDALPADPTERAEHVLEMWRREIEPHFVLEEERMLPALAGHDAALDAEVDRVRREHAQIRELIERVEARDTLAEHLEALGDALLSHVRAEERGLFEVAQRALGEEGLTRALGGVLHESPSEG